MRTQPMEFRFLKTKERGASACGVVMVVENPTSPLAGEGPAGRLRHRSRPGGGQIPSRGARRGGRLAEGRGPLSRLAAHRAFRLK